jgi:hypothetical protein
VAQSPASTVLPWRFGVLAFISAFLLTIRLVSAATPPYEPTENYDRQQIEGWPVLVHKSLRTPEHRDLADRVLALLKVKLFEIARAVPPAALAELKKVPIWIELRDEKYPGACYHPSADWLRANKFNPDKAGAVEIGNAENFLAWSRDQPWMVMHELAHAYHHRVLGHGYAPVKSAYESAKRAGRYDAVLRIDGRTERAYALNNDQEYFAESTEAYFGTNDFYPFVRAELQQQDPEMTRVLEKAWNDPPGKGEKGRRQKDEG